MKKQDLLKAIDKELLDKLFGFCYARTRDSYEAQELCSDITLSLVEAAQAEGEINDLYAFIWRVARNVYADFSEKKRKNRDLYSYTELDDVADELVAEADEDDAEALRQIFRSISFLTRAYREVMIAYYLDGLPIAQIAAQQNTSENAIRQRLFSARELIRNEVKTMEPMKKPLALQPLHFSIWGNGTPSWGDPRTVCTRHLSNHIVWLCREKPRTAKEISDELCVPMLYVEDELEILTFGANGEYGMLRRLQNGRYAINFILLDQKQIETLWEKITDQLPLLREGMLRFIEAHKEEYLAFPYINHKVDLNLILWQQVKWLASSFEQKVKNILSEKYFWGFKTPNRPFSVFGYAYNDLPTHYGTGCNGTDAANLCGYKKIHVATLSGAYTEEHFFAGHNLSTDPKLLLAIQAIHGLPVSDLNEQEREHAAKAIEEGYLYREGNLLYTQFLVGEGSDQLMYATSYRFGNEMETEAEEIAKEIAAFIRQNIPAHLFEEYRFVNELACLRLADALIDVLIEEGLLTPPENGTGAEGVWMSVTK